MLGLSRIMARRSERIAVATSSIADMLDELPPAKWSSPSLCDGWAVADVAAHLVWRLGRSGAALAGDLVAASVRGRHINPMRSIDDLARVASENTRPEELLKALRGIAADKADHRGRNGVTELAEVIVHGYDIAQPCGVRITHPPEDTHRVARLGALCAGPRIRTVLSRRTLVADDAGWRIGSGPEIVADAASVVLFIYGRKALTQARAEVTAPARHPSPLPA